jgi:hypothetical protein
MFGAKLLSNGVPVALLLALAGGASWSVAIVLALVFSLVAYLVGDLLVLPNTGNAVGTFIDGVLAALLLWAARATAVLFSIWTILLVVVAVMLVEAFFFHPFLHRVAGLTSIGPQRGGTRYRPRGGRHRIRR